MYYSLMHKLFLCIDFELNACLYSTSPCLIETLLGIILNHGSDAYGSVTISTIRFD